MNFSDKLKVSAYKTYRTQNPNDMHNEIEDLLRTAREFRKKRNPEGLKFAEKAYELARKAKNVPLLIDSFRERLSYSFSVLSDYEGAAKIAEELLEVVDKEEYPEATAQAWNSLGVKNDIIGNYIASRDYYLLAIGLLEAYKNITPRGISTLANAFYNLSKLFVQIDVGEEHFEYLAKADKLFASIGDSTGQARVWNLKATLLPNDAPMEERLALFEEALKHFEKGEDLTGCASCLTNVGFAHCHLKNFEKGIPLMLQGYEMLKKLDNAPMLGFLLHQLAEAERMRGNNEAALDYLRQSEEILLKANAKVFLNVVYKGWATTLADIGDYEGAYSKLLNFVDQVTERIGFDRHAAVAEAKLRFELEKKEKESELLKKKNIEIELFNERLQQSNAELNQFAYVASHDLKEPLRMVSNYMQLLEKSLAGNLNEDQAAYMRFASDGAKRMYSLIDSLLLFSRATVDTALQEVDLNDVLDEVSRTVMGSSSRPVDMDADDLPYVLADSHQMVQVFQNLIANAVKYNDKEIVKVRVAVTTDSDPKMYQITIADNGIGIPLQHREKVFDLFKRLHHKEQYSGTGIGLSICKKIIGQTGGRIGIEDSELGGTAFVFTLPAAR